MGYYAVCKFKLALKNYKFLVFSKNGSKLYFTFVNDLKNINYGHFVFQTEDIDIDYDDESNALHIHGSYYKYANISIPYPQKPFDTKQQLEQYYDNFIIRDYSIEDFKDYKLFSKKYKLKYYLREGWFERKNFEYKKFDMLFINNTIEVEFL